jgi:tetratricopeptide (TPR) repeat protein
MMNLRPWQLWTLDGEPAEGTLEIVATLESVIRRDPEHPGANHYYIHAIEASKTPERALPSAMRLGRLMPGAGHMVHMPSHIFLRLGDFEESAAVNEVASEVDRKYIARSGAKGVYPLMYYSHNLHFVSYARMMQGKYGEALDYAKRVRKNVEGAVDGMPMLAPYGSFEWMVLTRFGQWDTMLAEPEPAEKSPILHAFYRYARGVAYAGKGALKDALAERERLQAVINRIPEDASLMINNARTVMQIGIADLDARICRVRGDAEGEVSHWRRAVDMQDKLGYMEPPEWHYPVRESLGGALLRQGKFAEAERTFRRDLEINPRNGRSLFGLLKALEAQNKATGAEWIKREFGESWRVSPLKLSVEQL